MAENDTHARRIADALGRPWPDCGAYERQAYQDAYPPSEQAIEEGWCIIWSSSRERYEIQRDDEQAIFASDEEAAAYVKEQAQTGSAYHRKALDFLTICP